MAHRLGKIEKFVLLNLYSLHAQGYRNKAKDRTQILYSLYCTRLRLTEKNYRSNVRAFLPSSEYSNLQSQITRATKNLERKGLLIRTRALFGRYRFGKRAVRRFGFELTSLGDTECKRLVDSSPILRASKLERDALYRFLFEDPSPLIEP